MSNTLSTPRVVCVVTAALWLSGAACPQRFAAATARPRGLVPSAFILPTRPVCDGALVLNDTGKAADAAADIGAPSPDEPVTDGGTGDDDDGDSAGDVGDDDSAAGPSAARPGVVSRDAVISAVDSDGVVGVAASLQNPGVIWVLDTDVRLRGVVADDAGGARLVAELGLPKVFIDATDLELGPCPDLSGPCIFLADTGNIDGERDEVSVYAVPEPMINAETTAELGAVAAVTFPAMWVMRLRFPDDEAVHSTGLAVAPDGASLVLFEGGVPQARAFVAPAPWSIVTDDGADDNDGPMILSLWGNVDSDDEVLSAQFHWSGRKLMLSGAQTLTEVAVTPGDSGLLDATLADATLQLELTAPSTLAFGYGEDGQSVVAVNAPVDGAAAAVRVFGCRGSDGQLPPTLAEATP